MELVNGSDVARTLRRLSLRFEYMGRREETMAASGEAVGLYRELAAARPEAFNADLAMTLNYLSVDLDNLGRPGEALVAVEEAVVLYRVLAAAHPEAFNPGLAITKSWST